MRQPQQQKSRNLIFFLLAIFLVPFFALAANDVSVSDNTNFEVNTADTYALTTVVASAGGQVTNFDVEPNYIDITLDNLSDVTFTTTVSGQYLKITKQSGSNDYTVNPTCPTNTVTLTGTGATVVLRLEVILTDSCSVVTPPIGGGGGGGGGGLSPINGACGIAGSGTYFASAPASHLCLAGTPQAITGTGPWFWYCNGINGGANTVCMANKGLTPVTPVTPITPVVPPATATCNVPTPPCTQYMTKFIKLGANNDPAEVEKLENFLETYEGVSGLNENGIYDQAMYNAVKRFQAKYTSDILTPWGFTAPTGYVYSTTVKKINELYCAAKRPTTPAITTPTPTAPPTLPAGCSLYMTGYIKLGAQNDANQVRKLQSFLRDHEGFTNLQVTGIYSQADYAAVVKFQEKYAGDILTPWGETKGSGYVFKTTLYEINKIVCDTGQAKPVIVPTIPVITTTNIPSQNTVNVGPKNYFTKDLQTGMVDNDVLQLQKFLNSHGYLVAQTGPGSPGNETTKFGAGTRGALIRYQQANNISPAIGYFGPLTRAKVNQ